MVSCSVRFPAIRGQWRIAVFVFPWRRFGVGGDSLLRKGPTPVYAIIESGGKQFRVEENQYLQLGKLPLDKGATFETDHVLLVGGDEVKVGQPYVEGAKVTGSVVAHEKGRKVRIFKMKAKKKYRLTKGHRQDYTRVRISSIQVQA